MPILPQISKHISDAQIHKSFNIGALEIRIFDNTIFVKLKLHLNDLQGVYCAVQPEAAHQDTQKGQIRRLD